MAAREIFWDTGGFFAALNTEDSAHESARGLLRLTRGDKARHYTTDWVVGETCTLFLARRKPHLVRVFLDTIESSDGLVSIFLDRDAIMRARQFLRKHLDQGYSFVDCTSFIVLRDLRLKEIATTDRHFARSGHRLPLLSR